MLVTIAPAFFLPAPPPGGAAAADIARCYVDHRTALLVAGWIGLVGFPLGFAFIAGLGLTLRGEGLLATWLLLTAFISVSVTLAVAPAQGILALAVPYVARSVRPEVLKPIADVSQLGFSAAFARPPTSSLQGCWCCAHALFQNGSLMVLCSYRWSPS